MMATSTMLMSVVSAITLTTGATVFLSALTISLGLNLYHARQERVSLSAKAVQYSAMIALTIRSLSGFIYLGHIIYVASTDYGAVLRPTDYNAYSLCMSVLAVFSYSLVYFFFAWRLVITFQDSVYAVQPIVIRLHMLNWLLTIVGLLVLGVVITESGGLYRSPLKYVVASFTLWSTLAFAHLVAAFNARLFALVLTQRRTIIGQADQHSLSEQQISILRVVRKHTLLGAMIVVSSAAGSVLYMIANALTDNYYRLFDVYPSSQGYLLLFDIVAAVVICVDAASIFLGFTVNQRYYDKICGALDAKCTILCERMVQSRMQKEAQRNADLVAAAQEARTKVASFSSDSDDHAGQVPACNDEGPWLQRMQSSAI